MTRFFYSLIAIFALLLGAALFTSSATYSKAPDARLSISAAERFGALDDNLCKGQSWPHFSRGCTSWIAARDGAKAPERSVSLELRDEEHGLSTVLKAGTSLAGATLALAEMSVEY